MADYDITSDTELKDAVRSETLYNDTSDELTEPDLDGIIDNTKMLVHAKTGSSSWFSDRGLGLVLLGLTCARAKAAVENLAIQSLSLEPISLEARDSNGNEVQFQQYEEYVSIGMSSTNVSTGGGGNPLPRVSNSFIQSDPTPNS